MDKEIVDTMMVAFLVMSAFILLLVVLMAVFI